RDRPIVAQTVEALAHEVVGTEAKRDAAPVVRAAAEHAGAPPAELRTRRARVRVAVDLPSAVAGVELAEWPSVNRRTAMRRRVIRHHHLRVFRREPSRTRLEHHYARAGFCQRISRHPTLPA